MTFPAIPKTKVTFIPIEEFITTLEKSIDKHEGFAVNAFGNREEGKRYLESMNMTVKALGGKCFISLDERRAGAGQTLGNYSDTLIVCLPPIGRLPSLINNAERNYINFALSLQADEKGLVDKESLTKSSYEDYTNIDIINWDHMVIRAWWD